MIDWYVEGQSFGSCNCCYGCPCQFEDLPTHGNCTGFEVLRVDKGHFGKVGLDGLKAANDDQQSGIDIVRRALRAPARQIADNAGGDGAWIVGKLLESEEYNWGFNAATGEYQDLVKAGVIDPAKVVRTALQDAASVASLLITTEALVAELPKEENTAAVPAMDF